jgi:hypothetical protein
VWIEEASKTGSPSKVMRSIKVRLILDHENVMVLEKVPLGFGA